MWESAGAFLLSVVKSKVFWIVIGIIIVIYLIYRYIKNTETGPQVQYPHGGSGIPAGWSPDALATELHDVMDGLFTMPVTKNEVWKKLYNLPTIDMMVAVYNAFGQKYFKEGNGTLTDWIRGEVYYVITMAGGIKEALLAKLVSNNMP